MKGCVDQVHTLRIYNEAQAACAATKWHYSENGTFYNYDGDKPSLWLHSDGHVTIGLSPHPRAVAWARLQNTGK